MLKFYSMKNTSCNQSVTVGFPIRNEGKFLRNALESVICNYDWIDEILISDNNSTDNTMAICQEYVSRYPKIKYFRQETTLKSLDNFKFLLFHANSKYFFFMRGKNLITKDFVKNCTSILDSDDSALVAFPYYYKFTSFSNGQPKNPKIFVDPCNYYYDSDDVYLRFKETLKYDFSCMVIYAFFRLESLKSEFLKLESEEAASDLVLSFRLALLGKFKTVKNAVVYHFERNGENYIERMSRYKSMGFAVELYNLDWHLIYEANLLCRLKAPEVYNKIKKDINFFLGLSKRAYLSQDALKLRTTKGQFLQLIKEKSKDKKVVFFGTSLCAEKVHKLVNDRLIPEFYVDNNVDKQNSFFHGKKIYAPAVLHNPNKYVCVVNVDDGRFIWEIYDQMIDMGYKYMENLFFLPREVYDEFI